MDETRDDDDNYLGIHYPISTNFCVFKFSLIRKKLRHERRKKM